MTHACLNPDCDATVDVIGVCVPCANSDYTPKITGVDPFGTGQPLNIEVP